MPCEIGQNIYKLRKKNKQLLDQLESNSVLLENKIKMLRHTTRGPRKSSSLKDNQSSPLKRRHESWNFRNNSCRIATAMIKPGSFETKFVPDDALHDTENWLEKSPACDSKNNPGKRVRQANIAKLAVTKSMENQVQGRKNKIKKNTLKTNKTQCYCSKILENHSHQANKVKTQDKTNKKIKPQNNVESHPRLINKFTISTKCEQKAVDQQSNYDEKLIISNQTENNEEYISSTGSKSLDEARQRLNYSPESMFLRRMKLRLQTASEPINKDDSKVKKLCNSENIFSAASENDHTCPGTPDSYKSLFMEHNQIGDEDNFHPDRESKNNIDYITNDNKSKDAKIEKTSKQSVDASTQVVSQKSALCVKKVKDCKAHGDIPSGEWKFPNNKKLISDKCALYATLVRKCICKKEIGGLCCCEVVQTTKQCSSHLSHPAEMSGAFKSSASAPAVSCLKSNKSSYMKQVFSGTQEHLRSGRPQLQDARTCSGIQPTGYDVIAGLVANDREKFTSDPCAEQVEELSHFRQKHWFDCHAHPHGVSGSDQVSDAKECRHRIHSLDDDLMQPALDPCIRSFQLNHRLFPKAMAERHNPSCCVAAQGGCITSPLLPTQRRLVTLPSVPQKNKNESRATIKPTPGVRSFPQSNVLICDPMPSAQAQNRPSTSSATSRLLLHPVPRNSLALRFQKGVSQNVNMEK